MTRLQLFRLFLVVTGVWLAIGSTLLYIHWRAPLGFYLILPKLLSASLSPYLAILSATHALVSLYYGLYMAAILHIRFPPSITGVGNHTMLGR